MVRRLVMGLAVVLVGVLAIGASMGLWLRSFDVGQETPRRRDANPVSSQQSNAPRLHEGVVLIETEGAGDGGYGTGMVISPDGLVVTNYHVVEYGLATEVQIGTTGEVFDAEVLGFDRSVDIALLRLEGASGLATVEFTEDVAVGDIVTAVGNANGQGFLSEIPGTVTALDSSIWVSEDPFMDESLQMSGLVATTADIASGCSGGPVFDVNGKVVGVTVAGGSSSKRPEGYLIPTEDAQAVVDTILAGTDSGTTRVGPYGSLGALFTDDSGVFVSTTFTVDPSIEGATIANMQVPSGARDAGLEIGDVITGFDGAAITSAYELYTAMKLYEPGQVVSVTYVDAGGGGEQSVLVELVASTAF